MAQYFQGFSLGAGSVKTYHLDIDNDLSFNNHKLTNLGNPTNDTDAIRKDSLNELKDFIFRHKIDADYDDGTKTQPNFDTYFGSPSYIGIGYNQTESAYSITIVINGGQGTASRTAISTPNLFTYFKNNLILKLKMKIINLATPPTEGPSIDFGLSTQDDKQFYFNYSGYQQAIRACTPAGSTSYYPITLNTYHDFTLTITNNNTMNFYIDNVLKETKSITLPNKYFLNPFLSAQSANITANMMGYLKSFYAYAYWYYD